MWSVLVINVLLNKMLIEIIVCGFVGEEFSECIRREKLFWGNFNF